MPEVPCQHCMTPIEFPEEWAQQAIECPSCNQQTFLATVKSEPDPDAARPPKVQFVPPSDAPPPVVSSPTLATPQAADEGQLRGRVITINVWADNVRKWGAGAAIFGVLVFMFGRTVTFDAITIMACAIIFFIGLLGYAAVSYAYPTFFCCSICRNSLKEKSERVCPKCGAELGGEVIGE